MSNPDEGNGKVTPPAADQGSVAASDDAVEQINIRAIVLTIVI